MKGFVKVIIAGAVILAVGVIVLLIALGLNGWTTSPKFTTEEFTSTEENSAIEVNLSAGKLKIEYHDEENIQITYPVASGFETTVSETNGTLSIKGNVRRWYTFGCAVNIPETVIKIPESAVKKLDITLNAGTVNVPDGTFESVKISVNAGTCNVGNVTGCKLLDIGLNAGTVNVNGISAERLVCEVNAGSANIRQADCASTEVEVSAGAASLSFVGAKADYTATVNVSAGSCNGLSTQTGGDKRISVDVSAGSCNVSFAG